MKVKSRLLQPDVDMNLGALATEVDGRSCFVGIGLLQREAGESGLTDSSNETFGLVAQYAQRHGAVGSARSVHVTRVADVHDAVRKALAHAQEHEVIFFACSFSAIYDAVWAELNVGHRAVPLVKPARA